MQKKEQKVNIFNKNAGKAFTLAEVLITLGIIGIVAVMTIPTLIKKYEKNQTVTLLKRTYSDINNAIKMGEVQYGDMETWDYSVSNKDYFEKYLSSFIKIAETNLKDYQKEITYYQISGKPETELLAFRSNNNSKVITLTSGVQLILSKNPGSKTSKGKEVFIDLNGPAKPNTFGKDLFLLIVNKTQKRAVFHEWDDGGSYQNKNRNNLMNGPSSYKYQCNKSGRGMWCGALIMRDGWQIKDDYPW